MCSIAIILMLVAMLLPAMSRVRFDAQCTVCAANMRNIAIACEHYASENDDYLPRLDEVSSGHNAWNVDPKFVALMTGTYGLPRQNLYCPLLGTDVAESLYDSMELWGWGDTIVVIGYMVWIPRLESSLTFPQISDMVPPLVPGTWPGTYMYPAPLDTTPFAGPQRIRDASVASNPIITDMVGSAFNLNPPSTAQAGDPSDPYGMTQYSNHKWNNLLVRSNQAYADGRVEAVLASDLRPRYKYIGMGTQSWNWR